MYATAGSIAEEVLANVRTVISFNAQQHESARYHVALDEAKASGIRKVSLGHCGQ